MKSTSAPTPSADSLGRVGPAPTTEPETTSGPPIRTLPRKTRRGRRGDGLAAAGFLTPTAVGFLIFTAVPIIASLVMAFTEWPLIGSPTFAGLGNFVTLFTHDPLFLKAALNTAIFVFAFVPLNLVMSLGMAAWISPRIKGRNIYRVLIFLPVVTPAVANATVWQLLLTPHGIVDGMWQGFFGVHAPNFLGSTSFALPSVILMSLWQGIGYNLLIFSAGLEAVPQSVLEAAEVDGAGPIRRFFKITIPMLSPSIFFATIMTIITSIQVFAQPYVLTGGGPENSSSTLVMYLYRSGFVFYKLGYAAAVAWVLFAVIMLVTALQFIGQKKWVHYD